MDRITKCTDSLLKKIKNTSSTATQRMTQVHQHVKKMGGVCHSSTYVNSKDPLILKCSKGHIFHKSFNKLISSKQWCPACRSNAVKFVPDVLRLFVDKNEGKLLTPLHEISGCNYIVEIQCSKGHIWRKAAGQMLYSQHWCPECGRSGKGERLNVERLKKVAQSRGGEILTKIIVNQHSRVEVKCADGHIWHTSAFCLLYKNTWCPQCAGREGEKLSVQHIHETTGWIFYKKRPMWLKGLGHTPLELDAYCKETKLAIEYQGQQHYHFIPHWHKNEETFHEGQARDESKRKLCAEHGVMLFEIPYVDLPTPEKIKAQIERLAYEKCLPYDFNPEYRAFKAQIEAGKLDQVCKPAFSVVALESLPAKKAYVKKNAHSIKKDDIFKHKDTFCATIGSLLE